MIYNHMVLTAQAAQKVAWTTCVDYFFRISLTCEDSLCVLVGAVTVAGKSWSASPALPPLYSFLNSHLSGASSTCIFGGYKYQRKASCNTSGRSLRPLRHLGCWGAHLLPGSCRPAVLPSSSSSPHLDAAVCRLQLVGGD